MNKKIIWFVLGLALLLTFQAKLVMPFLKSIAASDLFLEDTGDEKRRTSTHTFQTDAAFNQCNNYIADKILSNYSLTFAQRPLNAFSLGGFRYVVNADIDIQPTSGASFTRRYACRIKYNEGQDSSGISNLENWSIDGISGLDNLD